MTTQATKRMRIAALGLSTALSVGVLAPFIGDTSASAAACTTTSSPNPKLATHSAKLHKAKKKLKKAKKHHASARVIKHDKKKVKKLRSKVRHDKANPVVTQNCPGGGTTTPTGSADPLSQLLGLLTGSAGSGTSPLSPSTLTDALSELGTQLDNAAAGTPLASGADQLKSLLDQIAAQISSATASGSLDPTAFQKALQDAAGQVQAELQDAIAKFQSGDLTSFTAAGLLDDILNPLITGLSEAGVPGLPDLLTQVQSALDGALAPLGLGALAGALPGGLPISL